MKPIIGIAISSLYIAVILVTITVIVGVAVAAYVGGVINLGISDIELLYIYPNSSLTYENSSWVLRALVENRGSKPVEVIDVYLSNIRCPIDPLKLDPGGRGYIRCYLPPSVDIAYGGEYDVKIYTKSGKIFATRVKAL